jgi:hypothetical protein
MERSALFIVSVFSKFNKQCIKQRFIQDHLLFLTALTAGGITTVYTVSAAAKTLSTTPTCERQTAERVKGYCTDREIFTLHRCTTGELLLSCCDSVATYC